MTGGESTRVCETPVAPANDNTAQLDGIFVEIVRAALSGMKKNPLYI